MESERRNEHDNDGQQPRKKHEKEETPSLKSIQDRYMPPPIKYTTGIIRRGYMSGSLGVHPKAQKPSETSAGLAWQPKWGGGGAQI